MLSLLLLLLLLLLVVVLLLLLLLLLEHVLLRSAPGHRVLVLHQHVHRPAFQQQLVMLLLQPPGCKSSLVALSLQLQQHCQAQQGTSADSNQAQVEFSCSEQLLLLASDQMHRLCQYAGLCRLSRPRRSATMACWQCLCCMSSSQQQSPAPQDRHRTCTIVAFSFCTDI
jgi:hypothetical protein